jgi:hypothetical protein
VGAPGVRRQPFLLLDDNYFSPPTTITHGPMGGAERPVGRRRSPPPLGRRRRPAFRPSVDAGRTLFASTRLDASLAVSGLPKQPVGLASPSFLAARRHSVIVNSPRPQEPRFDLKIYEIERDVIARGPPKPGPLARPGKMENLG